MATVEHEASAAEWSLAYLARSTFDDQTTHRGGALILTQRGRPKEFRCTSPIRPTTIQRTLYGDSLEPYLLIELIGKPLLESLREPYNLVLADDPTFLGVAQHVRTPVVHLRRQAVAMAAGSSPQGRFSPRLLEATTGRFDPVVVETLSKDEVVLAEAIRLLEEASKALDPLEPFQRIRRALERVHAERVLEAR